MSKLTFKQKKKLWYGGKSKGDIFEELSDSDVVNLVKVPLGKWKIVSIYDIRRKLANRYSLKDIYRRFRGVDGIAVYTGYDGFSESFSFEEKLIPSKSKFPKGVDYV